MVRLFDLLVSLIGFCFLSPIFIIISCLIVLDGGFPIFYLQERVGKKGKKFNLIKFRTMRSGSDKNGLLTVGARDSRITEIGFVLRKYKLDELPQLFNVIFGDMALVGPRPEVQKYVDLYTDEQLKVLNVKPGITDLASIEYMDENEILGKAVDAEKTYIEEIMPRKIEINLQYIQHKSFLRNIEVLFKTVFRIFS